MRARGATSLAAPPAQFLLRTFLFAPALIARRKAGQGKAAVEYIKLDEAPNVANAWPYPLKRPIMPGITHMMMNGSDEGYGYDNNDIMQMILNWSDKYIQKMKRPIACDRSRDDDHGHHHH